ncbi:glucosaminidase domain-containing protein, partial [Alkalibaculum sporogenes]
MYYKKKISKVLIAILITCFITQNINFTQILAQEINPIMGESQASQEQMVQYYTENSDVTYPQEFLDKSIDLEKFVGLIFDEAVIEGVRADIAFAQIIVNTNWLKFDGKVSINNNNFGNLKNLDGTYETFNFIQEGIRANIQHLKAHASTEPLNQVCVDPEYDLIEPKGLYPNVEDLENEDSEYSNKIVNILQQIIGTQITLSTDNELYEDENEDSNSTNEEKNSTEDLILENTEQKSSIATITTTEVQSSETTDKTIEVTVDVLNIDGTGYTGNTHTIRSSGTSENGVLYQFWVKD